MAESARVETPRAESSCDQACAMKVAVMMKVVVMMKVAVTKVAAPAEGRPGGTVKPDSLARPKYNFIYKHL